MEIDKNFSVLCSWGMLSNKELTPTDRDVYLYIKFRYQYFKFIGRPYYECLSTIADNSNVSESTARRSLKKLVEQGYITVEFRSGQSSLYIPHDESMDRDK